jgi:hypothetical protein
MDDILKETKEAIIMKLGAIAEYIESKVAHRISNYSPNPIYDKGEFLNKLTHNVRDNGNIVTMLIFSNAPHAKYVVGGSIYGAKRPPLAPIQAWVKRKRLSWTDKKGNKLDDKQMAFMIQANIFKNGIRERNVFQEVLTEQEDWIKKEVAKIEGIIIYE